MFTPSLTFIHLLIATFLSWTKRKFILFINFNLTPKQLYSEHWCLSSTTMSQRYLHCTHLIVFSQILNVWRNVTDTVTHGILYDHESHLVEFAWQVTLVLFVQMISHHIIFSVKEILREKLWTLKMASKFWYKCIRTFVRVNFFKNVTLWFNCPQPAS